MDERPEPQRVEIELTAHESAGRRRRRPESGPEAARGDLGARSDGDVDTLDEPGSESADHERGRLVAGASVIAMTALLVGVVVGRMGSGDDAVVSDTDTTPSTSVVTTTTDRVETTDTLPPAGRVLTQPATQSTTQPATSGTDAVPDDPEQPVQGQIGVHPSVREAGVEVVALTHGGEITRIDVTTGATVTTDVTASSQFGPPTLHSGDGWILVPSFDDVQGSVVLFDDGTRTSIDLGSSWPLLAVGTSGRFWRGEQQVRDSAPMRLIEISIDGSATGAEIDLNGFFPRMTDPLGGVVVDAPGGSYIVTTDGITRLTTGRLLALGRERAFVQECGDRLDCGYFVIDRATGERRPLALDRALGDRATLEAGGWWTFQEPLNAAEDAVFILSWDQFGNGEQSHGVLDLVTGAYIEIGGAIDVPTLRWGQDGTSVFWLDGSRLRVFDISTGDSVLFSEDLGNLSTFTLRPLPTSAGSDDEPAVASSSPPTTLGD